MFCGTDMGTKKTDSKPLKKNINKSTPIKMAAKTKSLPIVALHLKKIAEYYRGRVEYFAWLRNYLDGCRTVDENPEAYDYKPYVEEKLFELLLIIELRG